MAGTLLCEVLEESLEAFGGTVWHQKLETVTVHGGIGPEEVGVAEGLLEGAYRPCPLSLEPPAHIGKEPEAALVLAVEVHFFVTARLGGYGFSAVLREVFLNAATFSRSFLICDFLATLTDAPKWRLT